MQSACMDYALYDATSFVISAPTGAGKTAVIEMAILRAFMDSKEFTGDTDYTTLDSIKTSDIIVTTPEKWDSMTRRWTDYKEIMKYITLFVMDEVHILNEKRGAVLEACVSRMKTMEHTVRYVAVSATVPNIQDIADWLGATAISFSEDFRPVQLERVVYGIPFYGDSMFSFESKMDWKLLDMITKHSKGRPVLIFCSTRKSAQSSCEVLLKLMNQKNIQSLGSTSHEIIDTSKIKDKKLADFLMKGVGFHHGMLPGLETSDRQLVEQLFIQRKIRIVSTTSTLALGVNLPAHLVIIKSTKTYQNGALVDYSDIELLQMIGRAGRPGLEDSGCAVILTTPDMEQRYKTIMCGSNNIESCLHGNLVEHMMTEICLGTDGSFDSQSLIPSQVLKVTTMDTNHGTHVLKPTAYGIAMDRYCIKLETMITILKTETCSSMKDVLNLVSQAKEFEAMRFTVGEKPFLNALQNNVNIRFPLSCKVATIADKIFLVIQCVLGDISLHTSTMGASLALASFQILLYASRIAKCIIDCSVYDQDAIRLKYTLELYRCIQAKMWTTSSYPLRQIEKIGPKYAKMLSKAGIKTLDQLRLTEASRIEVILHRNPPFGNQVKDAVSIIPQFNMIFQHVIGINISKSIPIELDPTLFSTHDRNEQAISFQSLPKNTTIEKDTPEHVHVQQEKQSLSYDPSIVIDYGNTATEMNEFNYMTDFQHNAILNDDKNDDFEEHPFNLSRKNQNQSPSITMDKRLITNDQHTPDMMINNNNNNNRNKRGITGVNMLVKTKQVVNSTSTTRVDNYHSHVGYEPTYQVVEEEEEGWNDSPIELFSDTTTQPFPINEQDSTKMRNHLPIATSHHQQRVLSTSPLSFNIQKPQSSSSFKNNHTTQLNHYVPTIPTSTATKPSSSLDDDDFLWDDDDEWTQLAVQATEQAEKNYNKASSSCILPTRMVNTNLPEEEEEEEQPKDYYGDKMWHDIGEYCYNAFETHFKKLEASRPSPLSKSSQSSPKPNNDDSLKHWLDTRIVVVANNNNNNNNNKEQNTI
ncbi:hypothetical protein INT45_010204 [Circinella minor]|uniref:Uncharacterized protein n=1 Tax=Circinella minor TaxID=1195481 RepID=A0A8H7VN99_9FUNG|nr:hypothetical protein INT45_010204 [Circinella minor]